MPSRIAAAGMHDEARRLVDDEQARRPRTRRQARSACATHPIVGAPAPSVDDQRLAAGELVARRGDDGAVDADQARLDPALAAGCASARAAAAASVWSSAAGRAAGTVRRCSRGDACLASAPWGADVIIRGWRSAIACNACCRTVVAARAGRRAGRARCWRAAACFPEVKDETASWSADRLYQHRARSDAAGQLYAGDQALRPARGALSVRPLRAAGDPRVGVRELARQRARRPRSPRPTASSAPTPIIRTSTTRTT